MSRTEEVIKEILAEQLEGYHSNPAIIEESARDQIEQVRNNLKNVNTDEEVAEIESHLDYLENDIDGLSAFQEWSNDETNQEPK